MVLKNILCALFLVLAPTLALAQELDTFTIVIRNHQFEPVETIIPAGKKVKLIIDNQDPTPEEFESHDLNREKVISGGKQGIVFVGPVKKGTYKFVGEFHEATAKGVIIAQ